MNTRFLLSQSARLRYASGAMMYFAQGIPQGLLHIAMPAWLASQGVSAGKIASYLAVIILPWAFKLLAGPLMDRVKFLPMGSLRPWALGAQVGRVISLLTLTFIDNPAEQIGLLTLAGVLINSFAAMQDVAIDGMAIDLTPANEQGRLNAFMGFGKAFGWASTSALSGVLLVTWGIDATAIAAAIGAAIVLFAFVFVLEHEGEKLLPWTAGRASSAHHARMAGHKVFARINKVLWLRASVVVMIIMFFDGLVSGYGQALMPIAAVKLFGLTTPQWSQLVAVMGMVGAVAALALGPMIDRVGARRMLLLTVTLVASHAFLIAGTQHLWQDNTYMLVMLSVWILMLPVTMVCVFALAMTICQKGFAATQFAIYMSIANLGASAGSKAFGLVAERASFVQNYVVLGLFVVGMLFSTLFHQDVTEQENVDVEAS